MSGTSFTLQCFMRNFCFIKTNQIGDFVDEPYHIYFVVSEAKSYFIADSIKVSNKVIKCSVRRKDKTIELEHVFLKELDGSVLTGFEYTLSQDKSVMTVKYLKDFSKKMEFSITANQAYQMSGLCDEIHCNILYIGQSYGHYGERTAAERLSNHKTLQKILSDIICSGKDEEVICLLTDFEMDVMLTIPPNDISKESKQKINDYLESSSDWKKKQCIDIVEAGLINFFKPKYNEIYKDSIYRNASESKFKYLFDHHVDKIAIEFLPEKYHDPFINDINIDVPTIVLKTSLNELWTNNDNQYIGCDLNSNSILRTTLITN